MSADGGAVVLEAARAMRQDAGDVFATLRRVDTWPRWAAVSSAWAQGPSGEPTTTLVGGGRLMTRLAEGSEVVDAVSVDEGELRVILSTSAGVFGCPGTGVVRVRPSGLGSCVVTWQAQLGSPPGGWSPARRSVSAFLVRLGLKRTLRRLERTAGELSDPFSSAS